MCAVAGMFGSHTSTIAFRITYLSATPDLALALTAITLSVFAKARVLGIERVSMFAMGRVLIAIPVASQVVHTFWNWFQMPGITTSWRSTKMINFEPWRDWPYQQLPTDAMCAFRFSEVLEITISFFTEASQPEPTIRVGIEVDFFSYTQW